MKILIVSLAGIGDTLFAVPLIHGIRKNFPDSTIEALVMWDQSAEILKNNPDLDKVHKYNMFRGGLSGTLDFCAGLKERNYDISISTCPQGDYRYHIVSYLIGARRRLGHDYGDMLGGLLFTERIKLDYNIHLIDNNMNFLRALGVSVGGVDRKPKIYLSKSNARFAKGFLRRNRLSGRRLVGIHVGSGRTKNLRLRRWPVEHYRRLIEFILERHGNVSVLLFGGKAEEVENKLLAGSIKNKNLLVVDSPNITDSCALVGELDAFISVDTVFMNIAAAMDVPLQIVINTPTLNKTVLPGRGGLVVVGRPAPKDIFYRYDGRGIQGGADEIKSYMESILPLDVYKQFSKRI
jgi:ADP-heptose:LPS heptosyltransferase